jgi:hypothetical protein
VGCPPLLPDPVSCPDSDGLERRVEISKADPSLPQRAGKAYSQIYQAFCYVYELAHGNEIAFFKLMAEQALPSAVAATTVENRGRGASRTISAQAVARSEPDPKLLAQAVLQMAEKLPPAEPDEPAVA